MAPQSSDAASATDGDTFHFFLHCPLEIRLKIWRETWEPRIVNIVREHDKKRTLARYFGGHHEHVARKGTQNEAQTTDATSQGDTSTDDREDQNAKTHTDREITTLCGSSGVEDGQEEDRNGDAESGKSSEHNFDSLDGSMDYDHIYWAVYDDLARRHSRAVLQDWADEISPETRATFPTDVNPADRNIFYTVTKSWAPLPISLWVNHESRIETLRHYEIAWGLDGGESRVYFNFDKDILQLDGLDEEVFWTFHRHDLIRLQKAMVWLAQKDSLVEYLMDEMHFSLNGLRTGPFEEQVLAHNFLSEWTGAVNADVWTNKLSPDYQLTGVKHRYPNLREVFIVVDGANSHDLPHPTALDTNDKQFQQDDFRYYYSLDAEAGQLKHWEFGHFIDRPDLGSISTRVNRCRKLAEYCFCLPSAYDLEDLFDDLWEFSSLPKSWTAFHDRGRFLCKIALLPESDDKHKDGFSELATCDVTWQGQDRLKDSSRGHFCRFLSKSCANIQLWNRLSWWIAHTLGQYINVNSLEAFRISLGDSSHSNRDTSIPELE